MLHILGADVDAADLARARRVACRLARGRLALLPPGGEHRRESRDVRLAGCRRRLLGSFLGLGKRAHRDQALAEFYLGAAPGDIHNPAADHIASLMLGDVLVHAGRLQLLDAETDAALPAVHLDHQRPHHFAHLQHILGMIDALFVGNVADVDHALDALSQLDEGSKLGQAGDAPFGHTAGRELLRRLFPRIPESLLQAQADTLGRPVHVEHHGIDQLAGLHHVLGLASLLGPGEVEHPDQALDAGLDLDKGAEIGGAGHLAANAVAGLVPLRDQRPGVGSQLFEAERNLARVAVDLEDSDFQFVADVENVRRLLDAIPRDVGHMQQAIHTAQVEEGAEVGESAYGGADHRTFLERFELLAARARLLLFQHGAAVHYDVFLGGVELDDPAGDLLAGELLHLGRGLGAAAGGGQEGAHADIDGQAALHQAGDYAHDGPLFGKGALERGPVPGPLDLDLGELIVALRVAAAQRHDHQVADGDVGFARGVAKVVEREHTLGLPTDVDIDGVARDRNHFALLGLSPALAVGLLER